MGPGSAEQREGRCTASGTREASRLLQNQVQFELAKTEIVPADPLMQFGGGILLGPQIVGERERQPVDIGFQE